MTYIILADSKIRLFLLPKEVNAKVLHQRREHVGDVLQRLRSFLERIEQLPVAIPDLGGHKGADHPPANGDKTCFAASVVRGAQEKHGVCGYKNGVQVLH